MTKFFRLQTGCHVRNNYLSLCRNFRFLTASHGLLPLTSTFQINPVANWRCNKKEQTKQQQQQENESRLPQVDHTLHEPCELQNCILFCVWFRRCMLRYQKKRWQHWLPQWFWLVWVFSCGSIWTKSKRWSGGKGTEIITLPWKMPRTRKHLDCMIQTSPTWGDSRSVSDRFLRSCLTFFPFLKILMLFWEKISRPLRLLISSSP